MEPKYIYVFRSRDGFYKIGISSNVESRLSSIRTSNHDDVEIVVVRKLKDAFGFEQELHKRYERRISRKSGEWFKLNSDEVIDICIEINHAEGEAPRVENKLLEKILLKHASDQEIIKSDIGEIKKILASSPQNQSARLNTEVISPAIRPAPVQSNTSVEAKVKDSELVKKAEEVVKNEGRASASLLQRKLSIGYARAARLIDNLQEKGIVGPPNGAMPRIITSYQNSNEYRYGKLVVSETG